MLLVSVTSMSVLMRYGQSEIDCIGALRTLQCSQKTSGAPLLLRPVINPVDIPYRQTLSKLFESDVVVCGNK